MLFKGQVTTESLLSLKVVKCVNSQLIGAPIVVYDKCTRQTHCSQNVITLFKSWDFLGNRPTLGKNKHCKKVLLSKSIFHKMCDDDSDGNDKYDYFMMIVMIKNRKITWLWSQNIPIYAITMIFFSNGAYCWDLGSHSNKWIQICFAFLKDFIFHFHSAKDVF